MPERKKKRRSFDLFGFDKEDFLFGQKAVEGESGYSISVTYDNSGKPIVQVQTRGYVNTTELRRDIEQQYPGAGLRDWRKSR